MKKRIVLKTTSGEVELTDPIQSMLTFIEMLSSGACEPFEVSDEKGNSIKIIPPSPERQKQTEVGEEAELMGEAVGKFCAYLFARGE